MQRKAGKHRKSDTERQADKQRKTDTQRQVETKKERQTDSAWYNLTDTGRWTVFVTDLTGSAGSWGRRHEGRPEVVSVCPQ